MATVALIPAAGLGTRFHEGGPKALVRLAGRPLLVHALSRLAASGAVDRAVVAVPSGHEEVFREALAGLPLPCLLTPGGATRRESVANAFQAASPGPDDLVCVHDAARPLVPPGDVAAVVEAARRHGAAILGTDVTDTVKRVREGRVVETVPRTDLFAAATPQVFRASLLGAALAGGAFDATDDAEVAERAGVDVQVVRGARWNLKVTYAEDLAWAEAWLAARGEA